MKTHTIEPVPYIHLAYCQLQTAHIICNLGQALWGIKIHQSPSKAFNNLHILIYIYKKKD